MNRLWEKLTFKIDLKNRLSDTDVENFYGTGLPAMHMSLGYKDGHYASECQNPVFISDNPDATYTINLRLKGELSIPGHEFIIDYVYASLSGVFHPYPLTEFIPEIFMCKGGKYLGEFDGARRTCSFDITYNRSGLSFHHLYFNLFVNLAGQQRINEVKLRIDKDSFFDIYAENAADRKIMVELQCKPFEIKLIK